MEFTIIDKSTWPRKEYFEHYFSDIPCTYSMTVKLDITNIKAKGQKLYPTMLADENFARFRKVFGQCQDVRRLGSAALELAYTACGRQGGYFEIYLNPWDYAAGMLLIQEAGGQVTDFAGRPLDPRKGGSVVATNGCIHDELLRLL